MAPAAGSLQSQPDSAKPMLSVTVPSDNPAGAFAPGPRGETLTPRGEPSTTNEASKGELPDGLNRMGSFTAEQLAAFGYGTCYSTADDSCAAHCGRVTKAAVVPGMMLNWNADTLTCAAWLCPVCTANCRLA